LPAALVYAFLPYHFLRGESHLFLASYFLVPPAVMVILWVLLGEPLFGIGRAGMRSARAGFKTIAAAVICLLVGAGGVYYAFFACFFLFVSGAAAAWQQKHWRPMLASVLLAALIAISLLVNLTPLILYQRANGINASFVRPPELATFFGLNIVQLLLPVTGHRVPFLANLKTIYNSRTFAPLLINDNDFSTLGFFGSVGFVFLIAWLVMRSEHARFSRLLTALATLNLSAIILATTGGLGALFAFVVSAQIRGYNRISIYIAFFAIFGSLILAQAARRRWATSLRRDYVFCAALGVLVVLAVLDQTTSNFIPEYEQNQQAYASDEAFVRSIESVTPVGASIFQLLYVPFPENPNVERMKDYDLFRPYLHSTQLRWSYGTVRNRERDDWQRAIAAEPPDDMLKTLALAGYDGIYIDRYGFADSAGSLEEKFQARLAIKPIVSQNERYSFFMLTPFRIALRAQDGEQQWQHEESAVLFPPLAEWAGGFTSNDSYGPLNWHWSTAEGDLYIDNPTAQSKTAAITLQLATAEAAASHMQIDSEWFSQELTINSQPQTVSRTVTLLPGRHVLRFRSDAPRAPVMGTWDFRFRVMGLRIQEQ
jgi:hypothetical protein